MTTQILEQLLVSPDYFQGGISTACWQRVWMGGYSLVGHLEPGHGHFVAGHSLLPTEWQQIRVWHKGKGPPLQQPHDLVSALILLHLRLQ